MGLGTSRVRTPTGRGAFSGACLSYPKSSQRGSFVLLTRSPIWLCCTRMTEELRHEDLPGYGQMLPIFEAVGREYKMTLPAMLHGKTPTPLQARQVCCWLTDRLKLRLTYVEIAQVLRRSRNCAPQGIAAIGRLRETDPWLRETTDRLLAELSRT